MNSAGWSTYWTSVGMEGKPELEQFLIKVNEMLHDMVLLERQLEQRELEPK